MKLQCFKILEHFAPKLVDASDYSCYSRQIMNEQFILQNKLQERFFEIKSRNPSFSMRSFAKKMGLSSGALSGILHGKRNVSCKLASRIVGMLCLDPQESNQILKHFKDKSSAKPVFIPYLQLSADQFHIISDWYHFAILSLMKTDDFRHSPEWIAKRLDLRVSIVHDAIKRLVRIGLIRIDKNKYIRNASNYSTTDHVVSVALRKAHAQNLELARRSLETDDICIRDLTATTMAVDPAKIPQAKEMIRQFQDQLMHFLESGSKKEIYKISVQLFPLTKMNKELKL